MGKLIVGMTFSLDGFVNDPNGSVALCTIMSSSNLYSKHTAL